MALTPTVGTGQIITPTWGNQIRDRTIQNFATLAELNAGWSTAPDGSIAVTTDTYVLYSRRAGAWVPHYQVGRSSLSYDAGGITTVGHILGRTPAVVLATPHASANVTLMVTAMGSTTFQIRALIANTGANFTGALMTGWWAT